MKIIKIISICLIMASCAGLFSLPYRESISKMSASLYNRAGRGPDIEKFTILANDYDKILALFNGRSLDLFPYKWQVLGYITIENISCNTLEIQLFWTGDDLGAFSINDTYYRGTTDAEIIAVLIDCYKASQNNQKILSNP